MTRKQARHNVNQQFDIQSTDVELLADYFIAAAGVIGIKPTYGDICKRVYGELGKKYPIMKCDEPTRKGIFKFINEQIFKTYIWR